MNIKLICDSLCDIPDEIANKKYLEVVPLTLIMGGKEYKDGIDISKEEFYDEVLRTGEIPKTSQATYVQFKDAFERAVEENKVVICINGSAASSGTYQSAVLAKSDTSGEIHVFDTEQLSLGAGQFVIRACDFVEEGLSADEIIERLHAIKESTQILFAPATFDFLKKSGRVQLTTAIIGNLLNIKPILKMHRGIIGIDTKVRGVKKLVTKLVDIVLERNSDDLSSTTVTIGYGCNSEDFQRLKEEVEKRLSDKVKKIMVAKGGACICAHTGPDIIAISFSK